MSSQNVRSPAPPLPDWLDRMLPFDRYRVDVGAFRMHVMEVGSGPTVVLSHGNPTWGFLNRKIAELLKDDFRVIMPDLVGLGLSDKPYDSSMHTLPNHTRWFRKCLDLLGIEDAIYVGQDWGGPIAFSAALERPEEVRGLVVMNTVLAPPKPGFKATSFHKFSNMPVVSDFVFRIGGFPQVNLGVAQGDKSSIRGDVSRAYRWPLRRFRENRAPLALARMVPSSLDHPSVEPLSTLAERVEAYDGPAAIVWGKRDPVLGRLLKRTKRAFPSAKVWETGGGHFLQEEVPDEIAAAVRHVHGLALS